VREIADVNVEGKRKQTAGEQAGRLPARLSHCAGMDKLRQGEPFTILYLYVAGGRPAQFGNKNVLRGNKKAT
jgi:hypothetical protein